MTFEVVDRLSFGNMKCVVLKCTDMQTAGSTYETGWSRTYAIKATNNTDSSDGFKEAIGANSATSTKGQITLTPVTADDDGLAVVWGK